MRTNRKLMFDASGGVQGATSWPLRAQNELEDATNARFNETIGQSIRRNGFVKEGSAIQAGKAGLGLHEAKFSNGSKLFAATNNSGDTATVLKTYTKGTGAWAELTMPTALAKDTEINIQESLDEAYVAGMTTSRMKMVNIKNDLTLSEDRSLLFAPKARFITEFGGSLYAMNVEVGSDVYPDRAYKSSPALGVITYTRGAQNTTSTNKLNVDTVRYLKENLVIDIYDHNTQTALYTNLTIRAVDKTNDAITLPVRDSMTFTAATTDVVTVSDTTSFTTGTPIVLTSTTVLPAPLVADVVYYTIKVSSTKMKLAGTKPLATAGTPIDITDTGTGTHTIYNVYTVSDNDEIWVHGRYGEQYYMWNTDYPTEQTADYLKIPSGAAANSAIVGYGKSNNRLFMFTDTTTHKWDKQNLITRFDTIGLANHKTVQNIGDWLIWLDTDNRVNAYNDSTGQHEFISKGVSKKYLKDLSLSNITSAAAGISENMYKLCLGTVDGSVLRMNYDFDTNTWAPDVTNKVMTSHIQSVMSGKRRLYFLSEGQLWLDDEGDLDDTLTIPFRLLYGRRNYETNYAKNLHGFEFYGKNMSGAIVKVYPNGKSDPIKVGQLTDDISKIKVNNQSPIRGNDVNIEVTLNSDGSPIAVDGHVPYYSVEEDNIG